MLTNKGKQRESPVLNAREITLLVARKIAWGIGGEW